jgi:hypothetical protein
MKFLRESEVPARPDDIVCRVARLVHLIAGMVLCGLGGGAVSLLAASGDFGRFWPTAAAAVFVVMFLLMGWGFLGSWRATLRPTAWVLRASVDGLYVKFRSYLNYRFPPNDAIVAFLPRRDVVWLRARRTRQGLPLESGEGPTTRTDAGLDIKLRGDLDALAEQLRLERGRWSPLGRFGRSRSPHFPVTIDREGFIRVELARPEAVAASLAARYPAIGATDVTLPDFDDLGRDEQEQRILDFAQAGDTMTAIKLARRVYGYDLTQAKNFVDQLMGK